MFDTVLDAFAELVGCDRSALATLVGQVPDSAELTPKQLVERVVAQENAANAVQAAQAHDLAAFARARLAADVAAGCPDGLAGRSAAVEVGLACRVSTVSAQYRIHYATRAVVDHPELLRLVGTGPVSMGGLRRVLDATDILDPDQRRAVDARLARDVCRARLSPAKLDTAAQARVLAADPDAAAKRAAKARATSRCVRLGDPADGVAGIYARLRAEEALAVFRRLDGTARGMRRDGDHRSIDTLMADLFVEWATGIPMTRPHTTRPAGQTGNGTAGRADAGTTGQTADGTGRRTAGTAGAAGGGSPVWRSTNGCPPWTWSAPPAWPTGDDPDPADPVWDGFCEADARPGPAQWTTRRPAGDPVDHDLGDHIGGDTADGLAAHPAHGPPGSPPGNRPGSRPGSPPGSAPGSPPGNRPGSRPGSRPARAPGWRLPGNVEVQVVISAATLLGLDDQPGMLRGYGAVPAAVIRDIVDTAEATGGSTSLRGLFCDPVDGRLVAMDSTARYVTGGLRQFGLCRDQDCRLTGGGIVDLDHITDHHHGGQTAAANTQGLGKLAHLLKDHPGMHAVAAPPRTVGDGLDQLRTHAPDIDWTTPSGHTYRQPPPPTLGHGTHPHPDQTDGDQPDDQTDAQPSVGEQHFAALIATAGASPAG